MFTVCLCFAFVFIFKFVCVSLVLCFGIINPPACFRKLLLKELLGFFSLFVYKVSVKWSETEKAFVFSFAHLGVEASGHQHEVIAKILQVEFSKHYNLPYVIQVAVHVNCS